MTSIHATDATSALYRLVDMGIEPFLMASSLVGVVGQRLVRKICPSCVMPYEPTADEREMYLRFGGADKEKFVHGTGCNYCSGTGYRDRVGVYEVLTPAASVGSRKSYGGTAPDQVRAQIARWKEDLS